MISESRRQFFYCQLFYLSCYLPFWKQHPWQLLLFVLIFIVLSWSALSLKPGRLISFLRLGLLTGSVFFIYSHYSTMRGLEPGLGLLVLVTALKSFELKSIRDFYIFLFMCIIVLVGHLLNVDSLVAVLYIVVLTFLFFLMMGFRNKGTWRDDHKQQRRRDIIYIFIWAIPLALILFFVFPRFYVGHYALGGVDGKSKMGFTERLRPGELSELAQDRTPLFRAQFIDGQKTTGLDLYWRGSLLQETQGFNWDRGVVPERAERFGYFRQKAKKQRIYQVDYNSTEKEYLFTLPQTYDVTLLHNGKLHFIGGELFRALGVSVHRLRYQAQTATEWQWTTIDDEERALYLQLPESLSLRLRNFVEQFKGDFLNDRDRAQGLMQYFRERQFVYTLNPGSYEGRYPEDEFFFQRRRGFCEHYASVTALIFRMMDIPSRVVTGFQGGLYNPVGDYFTIRGEDAHAWVEAFIQGEGWVRFDPIRAIAPERIEYGAQDYFLRLSGELGDFDSFLAQRDASVLQRAIYTMDALYYRANLFFTSYSFDQQEAFLFNLGMRSFRPKIWLMITGGIIFFFSALAIFFSEPRRKKRDKLGQAFSLLCAKCFRLTGVEKQTYETAQKYLERIASILTLQQRQELEVLFHEYLRLRYLEDKNYSLNRAYLKNVKKWTPSKV